MGQYYYIVNPDKKQYLYPHKFGCGLKLMEFVGASHGPLEALGILLAHSNGRGGGDLRVDSNLQDAHLVGSWAGDRIVVAGDYDDPGFLVPPGFDSGETLYRVASEHFEDISDRVMTLVAARESSYGHPWAAVDRDSQGWRDTPLDGVLPDEEPKNPLGGKKAWETYKASAKPYHVWLADEMVRHCRRHPGEASVVAAMLKDLLEEEAAQ